MRRRLFALVPLVVALTGCGGGDTMYGKGGSPFTILRTPNLGMSFGMVAIAVLAGYTRILQPARTRGSK